MRTLLLLAVLIAPAECEDILMPLSDQNVQIISAVKPASTPRDGVLTLADPDLVVPVAGGVNYAVDAYIIVDNPGAVAGFRWTWLVPTHDFGFISTQEIQGNVGLNPGNGTAGAWSGIVTIATGAAQTHFRFTGSINVRAGNPGFIRFTWGQFVNDAADQTSVLGSSWLRAHRL